MTPNRGRIVCHLTALIVSLSAEGCFVPGGGWTMRSGVDVRCLKKPAVFVELVDTRWDEYNRIAVMNSCPATVTVSPAGFASGAGPHLMEGVSVPPASDPRSEPAAANPPDPGFPGNSSGIKVPQDEPSRLPGGTSDEPAQKPMPRNAPTARRTALEGPTVESSSNDDTAADVTATAASAPSPAAKRAKRPMASRLFSRPQ
jgi:hypothetical protein